MPFISVALDTVEDEPDPLRGQPWRLLAEQTLALSWNWPFSNEDIDFLFSILDHWKGDLTPKQAWRLRKMHQRISHLQHPVRTDPQCLTP